MKSKNQEGKMLSRRGFLQTSKTGAAAAVLTTLAAPSIARGASPASDPVRIGHIGLGTRGGGQLVNYTGDPQTESAKVVAVCDVYTPHLQRGVNGSNNPDVKQYRDYQDLLADPKVEAVVIATPDHWHERMLLDAVAADKDVYCEKGWTISIEAAKRMRAAVKRSGRVFQLGHQGRQHPAAYKARELLKEGILGEVTLVHTGRYFNGTQERPPWRWYGGYSNYNRPDPNQVRKSVDWEKWLGAAPSIEFDERRFWHWRCYWPYGTGQAGDLLSHELDYVQSVLGYGIPDTCMCAGLNAYWKDDREVPDTWMAAYQFEEKNCTLLFEGLQNSKREQPPEIIGRNARMIFNSIGQSATRFQIYEDGSAFVQHPSALPGPLLSYAASKEDLRPNHMEDFLRCVRTRERCQCNEDEAFIEVATLLMSVKSYFAKRQVRWDKVKEEIV